MGGRLIAFLIWWVRVGARFLQVAPFATSLVILLSLVSQVSLLGALLLPLKVVVLLGSNGSSRFLFGPLKEIPHETLIIALTASALAFYATHLLATNIGARLSQRGSEKLLLRTSKLVLFENQDEIVTRAFSKYASSLAQILFALVGMVALSMIYPDLLVWMSAYVVVAALLIVLYIVFHPIRTAIADKFQQTTRLLGVIGFLSVFGYIVADFLWWSPPVFWKAIVGLILGRQICMQAAGGVAGANALGNQKEKINALLFHRTIFLPQSSDNSGSVWSLLESAELRDWVARVLPEGGSAHADDLEISWRQSAVKGVLNLIVKIKSSERYFLVKVADVGSGSLLLHERSLLLNGLKEFPAPMLVGATLIQKFHCNVFDISGYTFQDESQDQRKREIEENLFIRLLNCAPDSDLVERFLRTKPTVLDRIGSDFFARLNLVCTDVDRSVVSHASKSWPDILRCLKDLPLRIIDSKGISLNSIVFNQSGIPFQLDWGKWTLEPMGSGWPVDASEHMDRSLMEAVDGASDLNLKQAPIISVIAAWVWIFEKQYGQEDYTGAIESLRRIQSLWKQV